MFIEIQFNLYLCRNYLYSYFSCIGRSKTLSSKIFLNVCRDIIQELVEKNVTKETDFNWVAQLRYYCEDDTVAVKIISASVTYANEYLGNTSRFVSVIFKPVTILSNELRTRLSFFLRTTCSLVMTPLTDRCYRTLIGAFHMNLNGAPEGPAGTGPKFFNKGSKNVNKYF